MATFKIKEVNYFIVTCTCSHTTEVRSAGGNHQCGGCEGWFRVEWGGKRVPDVFAVKGKDSQHPDKE